MLSGIPATETSYRTYFTTAQDLVQNLQAAWVEGSARSKMRTYTGPSVLVVDELGYLPMDQAAARSANTDSPVGEPAVRLAPLRAGIDRADVRITPP